MCCNIKNIQAKVVNGIHEFCIKYDFEYDNDRYIKHISDNSKIIIKLEYNNLILTLNFYNLKGENPSIACTNLISMDSIKSFIYNNSLDETLSKIIICNINKIYSKILFDNKYS